MLPDKNQLHRLRILGERPPERAVLRRCAGNQGVTVPLVILVNTFGFGHGNWVFAAQSGSSTLRLDRGETNFGTELVQTE